MIAAAGPSPLWYLTRATGLVTLVLLTLSVVLGVLQVLRWAPADTPRFVVVTLHRSVSLLVLAFLAAHVATAVLDPFAPVRLLDAVVPFAGAYRPLWLGLGACALDVLIALTVTSLLRRRLGLRAWRVVHWSAYACWPIALVHGWGTGSDTRAPWMLAITLGCAATVLSAIALRLATGWPGQARVRIAVLAAVAAAFALVSMWLPRGPLAAGWARRSGTPTALLAVAPTPTAVRPTDRPFGATLRGTIREGSSAGGLAVVDLRMRLRGDVTGVLSVRVAGDAAPGGGVMMRRSAVSLVMPDSPVPLQGRIDVLDGSTLDARVGSADGRALRLHVVLALGDSAVSGTVSARPIEGR